MTKSAALTMALGTALSMGGAAFAQTAQPPGGVQAIAPPASAVVIPESSHAQPAGYAHTNVRFIPASVIQALSAQAGQAGASPAVGPPYSGYGYETPGSLSCLYGLVANTAGCNPNTATIVATTKGSKAIAIVDAYDYPNALSDLTAFSNQFGLPTPKLTVKYATSAGACTGPKPAPNSGWQGEEALDLQMAHAMAPAATLYLVEAQTNSYANLVGAIKCANSLVGGGGEVSMSWSGGETSAYESNFVTNKNIVYFASSGDSPGVGWPSTSPKVVSVGGTSISRAFPAFTFQYYASWADAGEGPSAIFALPTYQSRVPGITGTMRLTPDISADANPTTGVWVYLNSGWWIYGGTSVASPLMAGLTNAQATFRANTAAELTALYNAKKASATADFATTTIGYCGPYAAYVPNAKWNYCLGVGTVKGSVTPLNASSN